MFVFVFVLWRPKKGGRRSSRGKYPGAPPHHIGKKEKKKADREVPDRPVVVKGERLFKKEKKNFRSFIGSFNGV
jgi:hypothetical protein